MQLGALGGDLGELARVDDADEQRAELAEQTGALALRAVPAGDAAGLVAEHRGQLRLRRSSARVARVM